MTEAMNENVVAYRLSVDDSLNNGYNQCLIIN